MATTTAKMRNTVKDNYDHESHGADEFGSEQEEIGGYDSPRYATRDGKCLDPRISGGDKVLQQYTRIRVFLTGKTTSQRTFCVSSLPTGSHRAVDQWPQGHSFQFPRRRYPMRSSASVWPHCGWKTIRVVW